MPTDATTPTYTADLAQASRSENVFTQGFHLVRSGVLAPTSRLDRDLRAVWQLLTWGPSIAGGYRAGAVRAPGQTAVVDEHRSLTFAEIDERTDRLAGALEENGVGLRTPVAILSRNHAGLIEAMVALAKIGAQTLLLNSGLSAEQVGTVLAEHSPAVLLADREFLDARPAVPAGTRVLSTWDEDSAGLPTAPDLDLLIEAGTPRRSRIPEEPGRTIVMTSGTTSAPRGARRPQPHGLSEAASLLSRIPLRTGERLMIPTPIFHTWGLAAMQLGMALHAELVLRRRFDAEATLAAIEERRVTALIAVPVMLQRILDLPLAVRERYDTSSLHVVAFSGAAMPADQVTRFLDAFGPVLYNLYGSTEASWVSIADPTDLAAAPATAGRPPLGTRIGILDDDGAPLPQGVTGQICVGNGMHFDGYTDGAGRPMYGDLMATGDKGYLDAEGRLFVVGRTDDMIVSGGENVFPRPVEEALVAMPDVVEATVVGVPDAQFGQRLAAYVVPRTRGELDADTVRERLRARLPRFSIPRDVFFLDGLPRNPTGKVVKRMLPGMPG
ncbi:AMP-binding protein [Myceligenerans pegani]|uniref:AMP-binding protein n=1 Tax=Myceligenerans pegani TaxID=2776917 RepID=UPI00299F0800|nr:AMP-binding protein [Myceligenerans sp. TRM 65318]